jgi:hypothetical protein
MNMDATALTVTGLIATVLSLTFAIAAHISTQRRNRQKAHLEKMLVEQEQPSPSASGNAVVTAVTDPVYSATPTSPRPAGNPVPGMAPAVAPTPVNPAAVSVRRRPVFIPPAAGLPEAPVTNGTPSSAFFKRFVVKPESATMEPVEEESQADDLEKFVWE